MVFFVEVFVFLKAIILFLPFWALRL
jgi:hypothetical protein